LSVRDDESTPIALQLSLKFGDLNAAQALLETLQDGENSLEDRQEAIRGLAGLKRPELRSELVALLDDDFLRTEAIRAMSSFDDESLAETLLERYADFSNKEKLEVVHALASRPGHGWALTRAIRRGDVPRRDVPAYVARLLQRVVGTERYQDTVKPVLIWIDAEYPLATEVLGDIGHESVLANRHDQVFRFKQKTVQFGAVHAVTTPCGRQVSEEGVEHVAKATMTGLERVYRLAA